MSRTILLLIFAPLLALAAPSTSEAGSGDADPMHTKVNIQSAEKIMIFNCHTWRRTLNIWVDDGSGFQLYGSQPPHYDDGLCPVGDAFVLDLPQNIVYRVVMTDPDPGNNFCKEDDPNNAACYRFEIPAVLGGQGGYHRLDVG